MSKIKTVDDIEVGDIFTPSGDEVIDFIKEHSKHEALVTLKDRQGSIRNVLLDRSVQLPFVSPDKDES